jgi:2-polyprenyl-6-methoxyphenol hydroxylase-like FAD-dependent oxidoreductase
MSNKAISTTCAIAGGGPAGLMVGLLLARAGVPVVVLEKHADFLRDFRGDTIHPSTLELMAELGLDEALLRLPHQKVPRIGGTFGGERLLFAEFSRLPVRHPFIAMMPQWDFLNFLAEQGRRYPNFSLFMEANVEDLLHANGRVAGLMARTPSGQLEVRADLVVAADGRHSVLRDRAGLALDDLGAPMDVLWFRLSRAPGDSSEIIGHFEPGRLLVQINRGSYWQCAIVIPKGAADAVRERGLDAFRAHVTEVLPWAGVRIGEDIKTWDDVKLLSVRVDRLRQWYKPGLLFIGDAAHAMSPIGGVGINLAIQDAVAAANILWQPLRDKQLETRHLSAVQRRREWPTRATQWLQIAIQNRVIRPTLAAQQPLRPLLVLRLAARFPALRRLTARVIGIGLRPEHIQSPELPPQGGHDTQSL